MAAVLAALVAAPSALAQDRPPAGRGAALPDPPTSTAPADPTAPGADPSVPADDPTSLAPPAGDPTTGVLDGGRSGGDPLAANGLGGALCRSDRLAGGLSADARANAARRA